MPRAIHQITAGFQPGDAISNEARVLRRMFRSWGYDSDIFSETRKILPSLRHEARDLRAHHGQWKGDDVVLLHLSTGSAVNDHFAELPCRKVIRYHNITPPEFFAGTQEETARHLARGRQQAARLAGAADITTAVSRFNASDLEELGYREVAVLPLVLDLDRLRRRPSASLRRRYDDDLVTVLFVGRCAPNKRIEDLVHAFYYFQRYVEPRSRLVHVGHTLGTERYHALLLAQITELDLQNVELVGAAHEDELVAYYGLADVFLCMSEHEGFCIPLIESMVLDVPVMAYDAGAVAETLDGAGVLFREKSFDLIAELMGRVVRDGEIRASILAGQRERIRRYAARDVETELRRLLAPLLS